MGSAESLLSVFLEDREICRFHRMPEEQQPSVQLVTKNPVLKFRDGGGKEQRHDLSSVVAEGFTWLHFSVRLNENFSCLADCLLHHGPTPPLEEFAAMKIKGLRFQPFFLSLRIDAPDLRGQGLFFRGLHFSGAVTPGTVSISSICDVCSKSFRMQSFHSGFSNCAYFYCSRGPHTLMLSGYEEQIPQPLQTPDPQMLAQIERGLPPCSTCGGTFAWMNPLLCPHCSKPFINFSGFPGLREKEYYGNYIYGQQLQIRNKEQGEGA